MPQTTFNNSIKDNKWIIVEAIDLIQNGEARLNKFDDVLMSDLFTGLTHPDVRKDYRFIMDEYIEEVKAIEQVMIERNVPVTLPSWSQRREPDDMHTVQALNLQRYAWAVQMWRWHAIPWRFREDSVYVIYSFGHELDSPIIHKYYIGSLLYIISVQAEKMESNHKATRKRLSTWMLIGIVGLLSLALNALMIYNFFGRDSMPAY